MTEERRRFFRINDTVGVAYRILTPEELSAAGDGIENPANVISLLNNYDAIIDNLLSEIHTTDPAIEQALAAINKKINCIVNQLELDNQLVERIAHRVQEVNISACGIAFVARDDVKSGDTISLDIALQPDNVHVSTYGTVVACEESDRADGRYIRVNFHGMNPDDREVLIQHIVQRQGRQIRAIRHSGD